MLKIRGRVHDAAGSPVSEGITIEAFEESVLGSRFDRRLGSRASPDAEGGFAIEAEATLGVDGRKIYLVVSDPQGRFGSVREGEEGDLVPSSGGSGDRVWTSAPIDDREDVDITVSVQRRPVPGDRYEAVVVGSGFGGSIVALTLANKYAEAPRSPTDRVCLLERGQWWVSGETPATAAGTTDGRPTIRGYLLGQNAPFGVWATPDDLSGFVRLLRMSREVDPVRGVYDFRSMKNVSALSASGVGGGSLIYFNLTARPDHATYERWAVQLDNDRPLDRRFSLREAYGGAPSQDEEATVDYFDIAERFLGVNRITTTTALGRFRLAKSAVFQRAAAEIDLGEEDLMNRGDLDADLTITDVPSGTFGGPGPTIAPRAEELAWQANVCERRGRCGLGCTVEARHTMSERLYEAVRAGKPLDVFPLCEVEAIGENAPGSEYRYAVTLIDRSDDRAGVRRTIEAKTVVLAAGTLGSTGILLRSASLRKSGVVGKRFSTNGDTFGVVSPTREAVDADRGPLLTSIARYGRAGSLEYSLEDLGIPRMFGELLPVMLGAMELGKGVDSVVPQTNLRDLFRRHVAERVVPDGRADGIPKTGWLRHHRRRDQDVLAEAVAKVRDGLVEAGRGLEESARTPGPRPEDVIVLFGMGRDEPVGRLVADEKGELTLEEPYDLRQGVYDVMVERMKLFAGAIGKGGAGSLTIPFWDEKARLGLTAHPLGGCPMGRDALEGVVDGLGRVYASESGTSRHEGLYIADGSIVPTSLGVNPSLTICALAFRIAEEIAGGRRFWPRH
ncbi:MAG: GMC oxidoreductase [Nitrososphaerales archaeon]